MPHVLINPNNIVIHGGWNGVLSSLLFQSKINVGRIVSIDIDPICESIARTMNKIEDIDGKFSAVTCNMTDYNYEFFPDVVINTSCEHITQETYDRWLKNIPSGSMIVLQSNDYFELEEHIRCVNSIEHFIEQSKLHVVSCDSIKMSKYTRYMIIGYKTQNV